MKEGLKFTGTQLGILFLVVLTCTIPGSYFGAWLSQKLDPKTSLKIQLIAFMMTNFVGFTILRPGHEYVAYSFGVLWGCLLGWFYPTESLIFSMSMPAGQESEVRIITSTQ